MQLNAFISRSGVCSRRKAVEIIKNGFVSINGSTVTNPAHRVAPHEKVSYGGMTLKQAHNFVYFLFNKPKNYICSAQDELGRKTIFELVDYKQHQRLFCVGRLDKDSEGVLLLTNDGMLAHRLSHPKYSVKKTYKVSIDRPFSEIDLQKLSKGIYLSDGFIKPDTIHIENKYSQEVVITLHSGKNRIIRRMIEHLNYKVKKLARVSYASLTARHISPGSSRKLTIQEITMLKNIVKLA